MSLFSTQKSFVPNWTIFDVFAFQMCVCVSLCLCVGVWVYVEVIVISGLTMI